MAAIDFPNAPTVNDIFTVGSLSYKWTGDAWIAYNLTSITWDAVADKPTTFTPSAHVHAITEVTDLTATLAGKAASVHTHVISDITDYVPPVVSYSDTFLLMGA